MNLSHAPRPSKHGRRVDAPNSPVRRIHRKQHMPGFETSSYTDISVLTMQLMPVEVSGRWTYASVHQGLVGSTPS